MCRSCDFCRRSSADMRAVWRTIPSGLAPPPSSAGTAQSPPPTIVASSVRTVSPTEIELAAFRCPPPAGCRFRFRALNLHGWSSWSLGSDPAFTASRALPAVPAGAIRVEVRLLAPFTHEKALLESVLKRDLSKALRTTAACIRLVELRLSAEYATIDLLPPDALSAAQRFDMLMRSPGSILFDGQAGRAIDAAAGLTTIHPDGTSEPFRPSDAAQAPTIQSLLYSIDETFEHHLGIGPSQPAFWAATVTLTALACALAACVAHARRSLCGPRASTYRYSRSLQVPIDDVDDEIEHVEEEAPPKRFVPYNGHTHVHANGEGTAVAALHRAAQAAGIGASAPGAGGDNDDDAIISL